MKLQHQNQQNEISMPMAQQADNKQGIYNKNNSHASQQPGSSSSGYISMYSTNINRKYILFRIRKKNKKQYVLFRIGYKN